MPPTASQARHLCPWENDTMQETYVKNRVSNVFGLLQHQDMGLNTSKHEFIDQYHSVAHSHTDLYSIT